MTATESLRDQVINTINTKIQYGELPPNEIITETQICKELNISRTPVREALIQLVADGVLKKVPRKGYIVEEFDSKSKLNLYAIYGVLDALAATLSLTNITEEDILKMHECVDKIDIALKYKNYSDYYNLQDEFHQIYRKKCDNPKLINMLNELSVGPVNRSYFSDDIDKLFAALKENNDEHREIIELFKSKDVENLEKFLRVNHWETKYPDMI